MECSQFILEFPIEPNYSFDSFIASGHNKLVVQELLNIKSRHEHSLTITGMAGVGKTHLLQAAASYFQENSQGSTAYLDIASLVQQLASSDEGDLSRLLESYSSYSLVAVDELEQLENRPGLQEAVLFLFNRVSSSGGKLLFASRNSPHTMTCLRKDLSSRLLWGDVLPLNPPDDDTLGKILAKMANDRQVKLSPKLIKFLKLRLPRRVPDYAQAMAALDRAGKGLKHKLTVPLAKKVLNL
ncbi:MAG: ATP-binding protein [Magnetococcales bacterium]|nr:ATP-binding protein [Magnetococcales bacterium]